MAADRRVLLTNDDGIDSPGLAALYDELTEIASVTVVAPAEDNSGVGRANSREASVRDHEWGYVVEGTPADCVAFGLRGLDETPDVVVAGPNPGPNIGMHRLGRSGTVGGAAEAAHLGTPGVAVSAYDVTVGHVREPDRETFATTTGFTASLVADLLDADALEPTDYLNVHVPTNPTEPPRTRITRPVDDFDVTVERDGDQLSLVDRVYDPLRDDVEGELPPEEGETDRRALQDHDVSISPLTVGFDSVEREVLLDVLDDGD
ncbi:5'-nucleotidase /3'-nucleotidase /exopolyphosphatase [Halomicrobium zhouii]|uniref:5'-nucleotidase SurE n=1 Tax=Halomicrobium zhouii TaxID=767519 RepID=A0A1I6KPS8_9EURY|nr:5'/3'-nucleotidase SurE [Halomicrobium zhouii]SFR93204.1 5'-nucleotidase /3'-nucleotidase /exopolyphosphatase [Halomicrobium zhouii]